MKPSALLRAVLYKIDKHCVVLNVKESVIIIKHLSVSLYLELNYALI